MLLPSDVARLVLGYLQEEGLTATSQAFIHESPNLKEYAEHTIGDGTIPACVFSLFGKGLTTILNEYVAVKAKESSHEVPTMMTSLWKKLDFTLNQIKSLQNSPSLSACQRVRSRIGMANMARQRALTLVPSSGVVCSSVSDTSGVLNPSQSFHGALGHSTPVCPAGPQARPSLGSSPLPTPRDSPVQIVVSEHRLNPMGPMSPGRRKWDTPRKRSGAPSGPSGPSRSAPSLNSLGAEPQPEEAVDENFPQLVIQNARDKILGDRSLQEKLAENINKILANEPTPQTSKAALNTVEEDQSIDEILGLQGEIHMSDDAIHDILEQTESDPAFQALFELFDCNKNKFSDGDGDVSSSPEESDTAGPSSTVRIVQSDDSGALEVDAHAPDATPKVKPGQERKNRKTAAPTLIKKVIIATTGRSSRIENSSARLLVNPVEPRRASSAATEKASLLHEDDSGATPMDLDEPLNTPPPPFDSMTIEEAAEEDGGSATHVESASSKDCAGITASGQTSNVGKGPEQKRAQGPKELPVAAASSALNSQSVFLSPAHIQLDRRLPQGANSPRTSEPEAFSTSSVQTAVAVMCSANATTPDSSTSTTLSATSVASTPASPASSCPPAASDPSAANPGNVNKAAGDSGNIMSLKIIISDNQEEDSPADAALTQAISSISGDRVPTIYLSSPAKSPGGLPAPKVNSDEVALAVSGLQNSEVHASPVGCKGGALISSPLTGTSQTQQNYIIQLPLDTNSSALPGATTTTSYFLVTDPSNADVQTAPMLLPAGVSKGAPLPASPFGGTSSSHSQGFPTGPALILPSPVKPMMLPVSVMGPNTLTKVQMVSNQLVAIPNSVVVQPTETVKPKLPAASTNKPATAVGGKNLAKKADQPVPAESQGVGKSPSHRRILCFDPSKRVEPQKAKATKTAASAPQPAQPPEKNDKQPAPRAKPAILGGNRPKRRVETVRCSADSLGTGGFAKDSNLFQHQQDAVKKSVRKQDHSGVRQESDGANLLSEPERGKRAGPEKRSKSVERKQNPDAAKGKDAPGSRSLSSDSTPKAGSKKDKEESCRTEPADAKSREGRPEKRTPSQATPNVTANKENEIKGRAKEQKEQPVAPPSLPSRDFTASGVAQPVSNSQSATTKAPSKTSSLAKQAAEMLQDIQGLNSTSTPTKRPGAAAAVAVAAAEPSIPVPAAFPGTPRQKKGKDGEGTPKHLMPPNTPDVPTCSPASEAGSESSINMAAHTLMILSRAAIARTGSPLKNSLRQEGAAGKGPAGAKNSKKRKQTSPAASPPAKKESKQSPGKKKDREKKKLIDCFPHDLDVDKFLSSLHYDE